MRTCAAANLVFLAMACWSFAWPTTVDSQKITSDVLSKKVTAFDSTKTSMVDQLVELASALEVPIGIEGIYDPRQPPSPEIHLKGATALGVLQEIVRHHPEYGWEVSPDIVHVFARSIVNDPRNYLNIRLPQYRAKDIDLLGMSWMLRLQIKIFLYPERYRNGWGGGYGGYQPPSWKVPKSIELHDVTVRDILTSLVTITGNALWISCIDPTQMMENGKYFIQHLYDNMSLEPQKDFYWDLVPTSRR